MYDRQKQSASIIYMITVDRRPIISTPGIHKRGYLDSPCVVIRSQNTNLVELRDSKHHFRSKRSNVGHLRQHYNRRGDGHVTDRDSFMLHSHRFRQKET